MKKRRKAQVSVFIILSILILILLALFFYTRERVIEKANVPPEISGINSFIENCLEESGEEAIYYIGQTGGYFVVPEASLEGRIAYYLQDNKNKMPSKKDIEKQISSYFNFAMPFCINDFDDFPDFKIGENEIETETIIEDERVIFRVKYPLSIAKDGAVYTLENFELDVPARLGIIYKAIIDAMDSQMKKTDAVCINCLYDISNKYGVFFHVLDSSDNSVLIVIRDEKIKILDEAYVFYYVNKLEVVG